MDGIVGKGSSESPLKIRSNDGSLEMGSGKTSAETKKQDAHTHT